MFEVILTKRAVDELEQSHAWWATNRSVEQADRWYDGFIKALLTLEENPERFLLAPEHAKFGLSIRQINYGLGNKPTHRALYLVRVDKVVVLRIRHLSQKNLSDLF